MKLRVLAQGRAKGISYTLDDRQLSGLKGDALEAIVEEDLKSFDAFFQGKVDNSPLRQEEKALLKTYLWWKTHPQDADQT